VELWVGPPSCLAVSEMMLLADVLDMMKVVCEKYLVSLNDWIDDLLVIEMVERRVTEERKK
jgi:hypothetical protein